MDPQEGRRPAVKSLPSPSTTASSTRPASARFETVNPEKPVLGGEVGLRHFGKNYRMPGLPWIVRPMRNGNSIIMSTGGTAPNYAAG